MLECVVNLSEGRSTGVLAELEEAAGRCLLDRHSDADHHRSVLTLAGPDEELEQAVRSLASAALRLLDLSGHRGVHPRLGTLDVVPFVSLRSRDGTLVEGPVTEAAAARDRFARWAGAELGLPVFLYGPGSASGPDGASPGGGRSLPELRRRAWQDLAPDFGPGRPHPRAGATAAGARGLLVAYNLWLGGPEPAGVLAAARRAAAALRGPAVRTLALPVRGAVQVSCNLIDPLRVGPGAVHDAVTALLPDPVAITRAELVGLVPGAVLAAAPPPRWAELGLAASDTIEARLEQAGLDGGSRGK